MLENLSLALLVTLAGMGLVFATIVLLWAVMAGLVRLARDRLRPVPSVDGETVSPQLGPDREMRRRAAAIAVAVALARHAEAEARAVPVAQPDAMTAWQTVTRGRQLGERGAHR